MNRFRKNINSFKVKDDAVAGIVVAIMIVGLVIAIISIIQTVYVPKWMEERESEHMGKVADQIAQLKFAIDSLSATQHDIPISTSITLGSKELGFLMSNRAYGTLAILPDQFLLQLDDTISQDIYSSATIKYSSENSYFLDQSYIYEGGTIILSQSEGNVMTAMPPFSVDDPEPTRLNITFNLIKIEGIGEKTSIGGYGTYPIRTEYLSNESQTPMSNLQYLNITTKYPDAWRSFLNSTLLNKNLHHGNDYLIDSNDEQVTVDFSCGTRNVVAKVNIIGIGIQIGPGWVE